MKHRTRKNATRALTSKAKRAACSSVSRSKTISHVRRRRRKRKVGVTLIIAWKKKKQQVLDSFFDEEVCTVATPKRKRKSETLAYSENAIKPHSHTRSLPGPRKTRDYYASDIAFRGRNVEAGSFAETTMSSRVSPPIVIDDSSDADCSSAADTTILCNTSAVNDACMSEAVDLDDVIIVDGAGTKSYGLG